MKNLNKSLTKREVIKRIEEIHKISKLNRDEFVELFPAYKVHLEKKPQDLYLYQFAAISARLDSLIEEARR